MVKIETILIYFNHFLGSYGEKLIALCIGKDEAVVFSKKQKKNHKKVIKIDQDCSFFTIFFENTASNCLQSQINEVGVLKRLELTQFHEKKNRLPQNILSCNNYKWCSRTASILPLVP